MLEGSYLIDDIDIWSTYNAVILKNSYNSLLAYPNRKEPDKNDWFEQDGLEVDLENVYFEAKDITIRIGIYTTSKDELLMNRRLLFNLLSSKGYRSLCVKSLNLSFSLRYVGASNAEVSSLESGNQFYLEQDVLFSMDDPLQNILGGESVFDKTFNYTFRGLDLSNNPTPYSLFPKGFYSFREIIRAATFDYIFDYTFDTQSLYSDTQIDTYGVIIKKINAEALLFNSLKEPLLKSYSNINGVKATTPVALKLKEKSLNISIVMGATSIPELLNNYTLFFKEMASSGMKILHSSTLLADFRGYYSKQSNIELYGLSVNGGGYLLEFDIEYIVTQTTIP